MSNCSRTIFTPFRQAVGPGELEIPAVRGLGGSLVSFTDTKSQLGRVWDIEFTPLDAARSHRDTGLSVVDHISQSMQYEEVLTWQLFYCALLDLAKTPEQEVLDPGGIVKSQVLQTTAGELRFVFNASQSSRTLSSRFLSEAFGSGVQHIVFATNDIFATATALKENGVSFLTIPENYYDDVEAKTDLPEAAIDRLKANNILYERDGSGEYLQAYTRRSSSEEAATRGSERAMRRSALRPRHATQGRRISRGGSPGRE